MKKKIFGQELTNFYQAEVYSELTFLFCDLRNCEFVNLNTSKLTFIGCHFDGGYISENCIDSIIFLGCLMTKKGQPIDLSLLPEATDIELKYSNLRLQFWDDVLEEAVFDENLVNRISYILEEDSPFTFGEIASLEKIELSDDELPFALMVGAALIHWDWQVRCKTIQILSQWLGRLSGEIKTSLIEWILFFVGDLSAFPDYKLFISQHRVPQRLFKASIDRIHSDWKFDIIDGLSTVEILLSMGKEYYSLIDFNRLKELIKHPSEDVIIATLKAITNIDEPLMNSEIIEVLKSGSKKIKLEALNTIMGSANSGEKEEFIFCLNDPDEEVRLYTVDALYYTGQFYSNGVQEIIKQNDSVKVRARLEQLSGGVGS